MFKRFNVGTAYLLAGTAALSAIGAPKALAEDCDIAIVNGRVMDPETNFDAVRNVCVKAGRIAQITEDQITGNETIEAYNGHPRSAGTHAKTLRLVRELNVPLMQVLAQNSYWSAKHLGDAGIEAMKVRGRMQEGMVADITIFDPDTVTDNAGYKVGTNGLPSTGIPYVLVSGVIMVKDSEVQEGLRPGQPIRYPVESTGRFKPLEKEGYLKNLLGGAIPVPHGMYGAGEHIGEQH